MRTVWRGTLAAAWLLLLPSLSRAQAPNPKFEYGKLEEVKLVVWKTTVQAGLVLNTGNANNLAFTASGMASRNDGKNKVQLDVGGTYARSTVVTANNSPTDKFTEPGEIQHTTSTTAALWNVKLRYDRFFTANDAVYIAAVASGNQPAGINVAAGAQAGYSRTLVKNDMHLLAAELGYDFTYQNNVSAVDLNIHSLRAFVGYTLTLSKDVGIAAGVEALMNLNPLPGYQGGTVGAFGDTRINGNASLNARLWKNIAAQISFVARYTTDPAPLAPLPPQKLPFAPGYVPLAESLDTVTSLSLVVTLL
jgi:hypothetical protein